MEYGVMWYLAQQKLCCESTLSRNLWLHAVFRVERIKTAFFLVQAHVKLPFRLQTALHGVCWTTDGTTEPDNLRHLQGMGAPSDKIFDAAT